MSDLQTRLAEAQAQLAVLEQKRKENRRKRWSKNLVDIFFSLVLFVLLFIGVWKIYQYRDNISGLITSVTKLTVPTPLASTSASLSCRAITVANVSESQYKITPTPQVGLCYLIPKDSQVGWSKVIGDQTELTRFSQYILDNSQDKSLDQQTIEGKLKNSLSDWSLDLTGSSTSSTSGSTPVPTVVLPTEAVPTQTPAATPTSQVSVVPWPEKERGFSLEELAQVMQSHNITKLSGENKDMSPQGRAKWMLYYPTGNGDSDYLVFSMLDSPLPATCHNGTELTLSLASTGDPNERWITTGDYKFAFICN